MPAPPFMDVDDSGRYIFVEVRGGESVDVETIDNDSSCPCGFRVWKDRWRRSIDDSGIDLVEFKELLLPLEVDEVG
jgi:hypothetical protein